MESYTEIMESLALTGVSERRDVLFRLIETMIRASERDIIAARWMAGGALLTSDEALLDRGTVPDVDTTKSARETLREYETATHETAASQPLETTGARDSLATARDKLRARFRKFRTFTPVTEQAFAQTLEHILEHGEEGLAGDIHRRVYRLGWPREQVARYLRRKQHTVNAFATCAGKLYASNQRLRAIYSTNRRSNELFVYENSAVETLLEQLSARTPPGFWADFPAAAGTLAGIHETTVDINGLHTTLLNYNIEAFTTGVREQIEENVMQWAPNDAIAPPPPPAPPPELPAQPDASGSGPAHVDVLPPAERRQREQKLRTLTREEQTLSRKHDRLQWEKDRLEDKKADLEAQIQIREAADEDAKDREIVKLNEAKQQMELKLLQKQAVLAVMEKRAKIDQIQYVKAKQEEENLKIKLQSLESSLRACEEYQANNEESERKNRHVIECKRKSEALTKQIAEKEAEIRKTNTELTQLGQKIKEYEDSLKADRTAQLEQEIAARKAELRRLNGGADEDAMEIDMYCKAPEAKRARQAPDVLVYRAGSPPSPETEAPPQPEATGPPQPEATAPLVLVYKTGTPSSMTPSEPAATPPTEPPATPAHASVVYKESADLAEVHKRAAPRRSAAFARAGLSADK